MDIFKKSFFLIFIVFLISGCGYGTIKGMIVDDSNNPLSGALIYTDPPSQSVLSENGEYSLRDIPADIYTVRASRSGFYDSRIEVLVKHGKITKTDIQLKRIEE